MVEKQQLTREGLKRLQDELRNLIDFEREEVKRQLSEARAQGDLSENADYDAARARQAEIEGRISELESIIANCEIIDEKKPTKGEKKIVIGSTVEIEMLDNGQHFTYTIVGTIESDPFNGKISNSSPVGAALIGKKEGEIVEVKTEKMDYKIKVISF